MTRCLYSGPMGYRLGDQVAPDFDHMDIGPWAISRVQGDLNRRAPTLFEIETRGGIKMVDVHRQQIRHAGPMFEIGRDGQTRWVEW